MCQEMERNSLLARKVFIVCSFMVLFDANFVAADEIVISGFPSSEVISSSDVAKRKVLSELNQKKHRLLITKLNGKYYWASRENRELIHTESSDIHVFVDIKGGGYIEIYDQSGDSDLLRESGLPVLYKEHVRLYMGNITYWGGANLFFP